MPLAPDWVPQNMLGLDTTTLVVVVVDTDPSGSEETVADLAGVELDGGSYVRGTADAEVTRIGDAWILFATDVDTFDLSDSDPRAGVWLATDGATDADRALIHYSPDPGAPDPAYTPTWPSGVYDLPIEPIDAILDDHDTRITTLENAPGGGGVPDPSGEDDGDVLTVSSGAAVWAPPTGGGGAPDTTGADAGDVLTVDTPGSPAIWAPPAESVSGAVDSFPYIATGEPAGPIEIDLSALSPEYASVTVFFDGENRQLDFIFPPATDRGGLEVILVNNDDGGCVVTWPGGIMPPITIPRWWGILPSFRVVPVNPDDTDPAIMIPLDLVRAHAEQAPMQLTVSTSDPIPMGMTEVQSFTLGTAPVFAANPMAPFYVTHIYQYDSVSSTLPDLSGLMVIWQDGSPPVWTDSEGAVDMVRYTKVDPSGGVWFAEVLGLDVSP